MTTPVKIGKTGLPILRSGQLREQVLAVLVADPAKAHTVGEISRALNNRSSGAIGQALTRLVELGHAVEEHTGRRRRWRANAGTPTPTATAPPAPPRPAPAPVTRPNGQPYYPRDLAGRPDVQVLRDLRSADIPVLLYGPPGTGKTSLVEATFGDELITIAGDGDTTVGDLLGDYVPTADGRYEFVDGPLVTAMEEGRCLLIDDATLISPKVLAVMYPAMDGRRQITVKAHAGKVITAKPGFYVIAGHNPGVHGAVLTDALASRFSVQIHVTTDYDLARRIGVNTRIVRAARDLAARAETGEITWAPQLRELLAARRIETALGAEAAAANLVGVAPVEDRDVVAQVLTTHLGRTVPALSLGRQL